MLVLLTVFGTAQKPKTTSAFKFIPGSPAQLCKHVQLAKQTCPAPALQHTMLCRPAFSNQLLQALHCVFMRPEVPPLCLGNRRR